MISQELLDYIAGELEQGIPKESVKQGLLMSGWLLADVEQALAMAASGEKAAQNAQIAQTAQVGQVEQNRPNKIRQKLLAIAALFVIVAAGAIGYWWFVLRPQ